MIVLLPSFVVMHTLSAYAGSGNFGLVHRGLLEHVHVACLNLRTNLDNAVFADFAVSRIFHITRPKPRSQDALLRTSASSISGQLVVLDQLNRPCRNHRLLRVYHEIEQGVDTGKLVVCNGSNRLLTHGTLILDDAARKSVVEIHCALAQGFQKASCHFRLALLDNDQRSANSSFVGCDMHSVVMVVNATKNCLGCLVSATGVPLMKIM
ncbi:hypothetical protein KC356_g341 [Hortaea werneckii]|nr:hypothetical protein KC356_g341 [Hortaea werneckii]